jgi:hypothetical protein
MSVPNNASPHCTTPKLLLSTAGIASCLQEQSASQMVQLARARGIQQPAGCCQAGIMLPTAINHQTLGESSPEETIVSLPLV